MQFLLSFLQICATEGYESQVADEENRSDTLGAPEAGSCLSVEEAPVGPGLLLAVERSSLCLCVGLRPCGGSQPLPQPHPPPGEASGRLQRPRSSEVLGVVRAAHRQGQRALLPTVDQGSAKETGARNGL